MLNTCSVMIELGREGEKLSELFFHVIYITIFTHWIFEFTVQGLDVSLITLKHYHLGITFLSWLTKFHSEEKIIPINFWSLKVEIFQLLITSSSIKYLIFFAIGPDPSHSGNALSCAPLVKGLRTLQSGQNLIVTILLSIRGLITTFDKES